MNLIHMLRPISSRDFLIVASPMSAVFINCSVSFGLTSKMWFIVSDSFSNYNLQFRNFGLFLGFIIKLRSLYRKILIKCGQTLTVHCVEVQRCHITCINLPALEKVRQGCFESTYAKEVVGLQQVRHAYDYMCWFVLVYTFLLHIRP